MLHIWPSSRRLGRGFFVRRYKYYSRTADSHTFSDLVLKRQAEVWHVDRDHGCQSQRAEKVAHGSDMGDRRPTMRDEHVLHKRAAEQARFVEAQLCGGRPQRIQNLFLPVGVNLLQRKRVPAL